jgi:hypothetical protein
LNNVSWAAPIGENSPIIIPLREVDSRRKLAETRGDEAEVDEHFETRRVRRGLGSADLAQCECKISRLVLHYLSIAQNPG